jgi:ATP-dependent Clp protease ATP-binding subunit ClpC
MNDLMDDNDKSGNKAQKQAMDTNTPVLDNFSRDLNKLAEAGKLDPVIGRDAEILRIAQILSRRKKNNPIIIGEPGCGKTALVEGLAMKIVSGECPRNLVDKRIVNLDLTSVVAGTKYRGQFEERMKVIIEELSANPNIIVFIDEIHTLVGSGNSSGSMDGSNIFKPALARGEVQCIGATTLDEFRKNIEKDGALERRFQKVIVEPSTVEETIEMVETDRADSLYIVTTPDTDSSGEILDIQLISIGQDTCGFYKRAWDNTILLSPDITIDIIEIDDKYKFSKPEPFLF